MYARESLVWSIEMYIEDEGQKFVAGLTTVDHQLQWDKVLGMMSRLFF